MNSAQLRQLVVDWDKRLMTAVLEGRTHIAVEPDEILHIIDALDVAIEDLIAARTETARLRAAQLERLTNQQQPEG